MGIALLVIVVLPAFKPASYVIDRIYAELETRQLKGDKYVTFKGEICYDGNGDMTMHYSHPRNYVLLSNKTGEVKMYDPGANTVALTQSTLFSSHTSQFYYFCAGKMADMGLSELGYVQEKVYAEKDLIISLWKPKAPDKKKQVQQVKLVHQNGNPIYMHYQNGAGAIIRKVYYYAFTTLEDMSFPSTTTEIAYEGKDSAVTKTVYRNFKLNQQANSPYFTYKIPANAKIQRF
ncbi:hypothetical protein FLA_0240 [Filimonas lacunae]|nr:hypothetical protein FLA_0240 [Filimonas lacunae]